MIKSEANSNNNVQDNSSPEYIEVLKQNNKLMKQIQDNTKESANKSLVGELVNLIWVLLIMFCIFVYFWVLLIMFCIFVYLI